MSLNEKIHIIQSFNGTQVLNIVNIQYVFKSYNVCNISYICSYFYLFLITFYLEINSEIYFIDGCFNARKKSSSMFLSHKIVQNMFISNYQLYCNNIFHERFAV